mgnify:CR=1 FL=1
MWGIIGVSMKRFSYLLIGIGILFSTGIYFITTDITLFVNVLIPYAVAALGIGVCVKKKFVFPLFFILVWVTGYNVVYIILKLFKIGDLYSYQGRIFVQLFLPLIIGLIAQRYKEVANENHRT